MMLERKRLEAAFSIPMLQVAIVGSAVCGLFYAALQTPLLGYPILVRYALCHWVAIASVELFCIAMVSLAYKYGSAVRQGRTVLEGTRILQGIVDARRDLDDGTASDGYATSQWLATLWSSQQYNVLRSWLGLRVSEFLSRQVKRRNIKQMDEDLRELADLDGDAQHASHGMIRIICWAMPMLGFLGTVLGISDTLGHMDAQALASGSQEAMNSLTSGLYVAFDTTAVGLILTMVAMFIQFGIQRAEQRLIQRIDSTVADAMHECLSVPENPVDTSGIQQSLRAMTHGLIDAVQQLVQRQSELWRETISEAHQEWVRLSDGAAETAKAVLLPSLQQSLLEYREAMRVQSEELVQLQSDGARQIDSRLQQWQTTISEQARASLRQQQEINRHAELLQQLLDSTQLVGAMQTPIEATLKRLTDIDRFHDAAICLTEAVAVLGIQLERHGYLGRQSVRRRGSDPKSASSLPKDEATDTIPLSIVREDSELDAHPSLPLETIDTSRKRRAG